MGKIVGIGETVYDVIFDSQNRPLQANPGGSVFNAMISVGRRRGGEAAFISEVGADKVGDICRSFLRENGVSDTYVSVYQDLRSGVSMAFLDEEKKATYEFYRVETRERVAYRVPKFEEGDFLLYGSFFAVNPGNREFVRPVLQAAREGGAFLYYDMNIRKNHLDVLRAQGDVLRENMALANVVKGSDEDVELLFGTTDLRGAYETFIRPYCPYFICTLGARGAVFMTPEGTWNVAGREIVPVSTIGAGDIFNAGM